MRLVFIYAIALISLSISSCSNPNGKYVVLEVNDPNSGNAAINSFLKSRLQGKEFIITFTNKYAIMEDSNHNKAYLAFENNEHNASIHYKKQVTINRVSYIAILFKGDKGNWRYNLRADGQLEDFIPVQLGGLPPWGEARCSLVKVDK